MQLNERVETMSTAYSRQQRSSTRQEQTALPGWGLGAKDWAGIWCGGWNNRACCTVEYAAGCKAGPAGSSLYSALL